MDSCECWNDGHENNLNVHPPHGQILLNRWSKPPQDVGICLWKFQGSFVWITWRVSLLQGFPLYQQCFHLCSPSSFPSRGGDISGLVNHFWSNCSTDSISPFHVLDMLCWIPCFFLGFLFWGSAHGVPQTNARPDVTDQELFWGSDQYDFAIVLPAAGLECFWHFAHRGERFYLNFMVRRKLCVKLSDATWHVVCFPTNVRLAWTPASVPSVEKSSQW